MTIEWANYGDQVIDLNSEVYDFFFRYVTCLYYGVLAIGNNEFGPINQIEFAFCTGTIIFSAVITAIAFGDVAVIVQSFSAKDTAF
jgi:hypothetical protein